MRLIHDHILRTVHENTVLIPLSEEETDFQGMLALNQTGAFLCKLLRRETDRAALVEALAGEYGKTAEEVGPDVDAFLSQLDACRLLIH